MFNRWCEEPSICIAGIHAEQRSESDIQRTPEHRSNTVLTILHKREAEESPREIYSSYNAEALGGHGEVPMGSAGSRLCQGRPRMEPEIQGLRALQPPAETLPEIN